jgi:hypothetical protein
MRAFIGVNVQLSTTASRELLEGFDDVVIATGTAHFLQIKSYYEITLWPGGLVKVSHQGR